MYEVSDSMALTETHTQAQLIQERPEPKEDFYTVLPDSSRLFKQLKPGGSCLLKLIKLS